MRLIFLKRFPTQKLNIERTVQKSRQPNLHLSTPGARDSTMILPINAVFVFPQTPTFVQTVDTTITPNVLTNGAWNILSVSVARRT